MPFLASRMISSRLIGVYLIGAALLVGAMGFLQIHSPSSRAGTPLTTAGARELDQAAGRLVDPGLFVAESVPYSRLNGAEFGSVKDRVLAADQPVRIAVLPGSVTRDGLITAKQLAGALHDRVTKPGVYVVLVDERGIGRVGAQSWKAAASADAVQQATDEANHCCRADYAAQLQSFVVKLDNPGAGTARWLWLVALVLLGAGALWWRRTYQAPRDTYVDGRGNLQSIRAVLAEELDELSFRIAALPDTPRSTRARRTLKLGERKFNKLKGLVEVTAVAEALSDVRSQLHALERLRLGQPVAPRSAPCFIDPRHGPAEAERPYAPIGLTQRAVGLCPTCAGDVGVGQRPEVRRLPHTSDGGPTEWANYWQGKVGTAYVDGYWGDFDFPDAEVQADRPERSDPHKKDPVDLLRQRLRTDQQ